MFIFIFGLHVSFGFVSANMAEAAVISNQVSFLERRDAVSNRQWLFKNSLG